MRSFFPGTVARATEVGPWLKDEERARAPLPSPALHSRSATLHRRSFFSDKPEILSAHIRSPEIAWTSPVRLQHHSIFSAWQVRSHRHQTLQAPVSIKPMVLYHPPCILIHPRSSCWKHLETYSLWLVLFQISPQPAGPILRNFSGCTISKVHVWCNALTLSKVTTS